MRMNVSATRMEMQKLKKSLILARRGWKLLKDKQDELMRIFLEKKDEFFSQYHKTSSLMKKILSQAIAGSGFLSDETTSLLSKSSTARVGLDVRAKTLFNLKVPDFGVHLDGNPFNYKSSESVIYWDRAVKGVCDLMAAIVSAGLLLFEIQELCREIASTRRRVNSLEYIMIPDITETVKYISFKLDEMERSNTVRLMKVKEIVRSH
ncbi:MAG: hypothetical protein COT16_01835 [Elusimicrobia bacterium CG08_land_8_20_14_0_20_44_26]|nr:MAG: hypothetical protein COT16_01835 [Elusimicrobia bacterium CG08_land_8_20_14_0_20_44_26]